VFHSDDVNERTNALNAKNCSNRNHYCVHGNVEGFAEDFLFLTLLAHKSVIDFFCGKKGKLVIAGLNVRN